MAERLFTDAELEELGTPARERIASSLARDDRGKAAGVMSRLEAGWREYYGRVGRRIQASIAFYTRRFGDKAARELRDSLAGFTAAYREAYGVPAAPAAARSTDLLARYDAGEPRWRRLIDYRRDRLTALISHVYREHGIDQVEALQRFTGRRSLTTLERDIDRPPRTVLTDFTHFLQVLFSDLEVAELDDRFVITQHTCGTCGRQVADGRYGPPLHLEVVKERHLATWNRPDTPIYRTHIPVWHVAMARDRIGTPWPVNRCPAGVSAAPCEILLFKDPRNPLANDLVPNG